MVISNISLGSQQISLYTALCIQIEGLYSSILYKELLIILNFCSSHHKYIDHLREVSKIPKMFVTLLLYCSVHSTAGTREKLTGYSQHIPFKNDTKKAPVGNIPDLIVYTDATPARRVLVVAEVSYIDSM